MANSLWEYIYGINERNKQEIQEVTRQVAAVTQTANRSLTHKEDVQARVNEFNQNAINQGASNVQIQYNPQTGEPNIPFDMAQQRLNNQIQLNQGIALLYSTYNPKYLPEDPNSITNQLQLISAEARAVKMQNKDTLADVIKTYKLENETYQGQKLGDLINSDWLPTQADLENINTVVKKRSFDASIDLIFTDAGYFDKTNYTELAKAEYQKELAKNPNLNPDEKMVLAKNITNKYKSIREQAEKNYYINYGKSAGGGEKLDYDIFPKNARGGYVIYKLPGAGESPQQIDARKNPDTGKWEVWTQTGPVGQRTYNWVPYEKFIKRPNINVIGFTSKEQTSGINPQTLELLKNMGVDISKTGNAPKNSTKENAVGGNVNFTGHPMGYHNENGRWVKDTE